MSSLRTVRQLTSLVGRNARQQISRSPRPHPPSPEDFSSAPGKLEGRFFRKHPARADACFVLRQTATFHTNPGLNMPPLSSPEGECETSNPFYSVFKSLVGIFLPPLAVPAQTFTLANSECSAVGSGGVAGPARVEPQLSAVHGAPRAPHATHSSATDTLNSRGKQQHPASAIREEPWRLVFLHT